jgi:hypothetical protein
MPIVMSKTIITPIEKRRISIEKQIAKWEDKLAELHNVCKHEYATKINKGSTGSWDRDDYYWRECSCPECGRRWNEEQK